MRIAILTLPLHTNYGGILQAYALQTVLERMGHEVRVLQKNPFMKEPCFATYVKRIFQKYIFGKDVIINKERRNNRFVRENRQLTNIFIARHIHTHIVESLDQLCEHDYDAFVVGSDQIWRYDFFTKAWNAPMKDAFLAFVHRRDVLRLAYAVSFGNEKIDYGNEELKSLVSLFCAVSVREKSGIDVCLEAFGINAVHVLDPTMLLTMSDYEKLLDENNGEAEECIWCYFLDTDNNKCDVADKLGREIELSVSYCFNSSQRVHPPVEYFLTSIKNAKYIVTDSFHACVFSIIFHKPFIVVANEGRGNTRLISLLTMFGLEDRWIEKGMDLDSALINASIDYMKVDKLLDEWRKKSFVFLKDNICTQG